MGQNLGDRKKDLNYDIGYYREKEIEWNTKPNKPLLLNESSDWAIRYLLGTPLGMSTIWKYIGRNAKGPLKLLFKLYVPNCITFEFKNLKSNTVKKVLFIGIFGLSADLSNILKFFPLGDFNEEVKKIGGLPSFSVGFGDFIKIPTFSPFSFNDLNGAYGRLTWFEANLGLGASVTYMTIFSLTKLNLLIDGVSLAGLKNPKSNSKNNRIKHLELQAGIGVEATLNAGFWNVIE